MTATPGTRRHCLDVINRRGVALSLLAVATIAAAYSAVPAMATITGRLISACAAWITLAGALETLSALGFVLVFKLLFGARLGWRQTFGASLRALGASTLLPAGAIVGPAVGARSARDGQVPPTELARSTIAFTVITVLPSIVVVGALGLLLWLGILHGPRDVLRTLVPAGLALVAIAGVCVIGRRSAAKPPSSTRPRNIKRRITAALMAVPEGVSQARCALIDRNWKLLGAVGYYAFDNAVLWAAFHAYGRTPPIGVIVMGYLVGSLGSALPVPAGIGAVEGGIIAALVLYGAPAGPAVVAVFLYRGVSLLLPLTLSGSAWAVLAAANLRPLIRHVRVWRPVFRSVRRRANSSSVCALASRRDPAQVEDSALMDGASARRPRPAPAQPPPHTAPGTRAEEVRKVEAPLSIGEPAASGHSRPRPWSNTSTTFTGPPGACVDHTRTARTWSRRPTREFCISRACCTATTVSATGCDCSETHFSTRRSASRRLRVTTALEDIDTPDQATDTQPEQAFAAREVYAAIATLPELFRVALVALDVFSLSYSQAARSVRAREG